MFVSINTYYGGNGGELLATLILGAYFRFPSVNCTLYTGIFSLAIIKGLLQFLISNRRPYKSLISEKNFTDSIYNIAEPAKAKPF